MIGSQSMDKLRESRVAVFGVGGVGSYVVEALARTGVGEIIIVDKDTVEASNINRQIIATSKTIGQAKVDIMKDRILEINPDCKVMAYEQLYLPETANDLIRDDYDYIVDAVDMVTAKIDLVVEADKRNIPIISAMGAGNKMDPTQFEVTDIYKTSVCPLAKVMRRELRKRNIPSLKVVYSKEKPIKAIRDEESSDPRKTVTASVAFVPSVSGLIIASEVIKDLIGYER